LYCLDSTSAHYVNKCSWIKLNTNILSCLNIRWLIPFIGHMGICTSNGIIRDFAGPYVVSVGVSIFAW
jgi:hypothetical protein